MPRNVGREIFGPGSFRLAGMVDWAEFFPRTRDAVKKYRFSTSRNSRHLTLEDGVASDDPAFPSEKMNSLERPPESRAAFIGTLIFLPGFAVDARQNDSV